jgi:hypothetical protein
MSGQKKPTEDDLAAQLRANLRRRKQAARKQKSTKTEKTAAESAANSPEKSPPAP